jgi:UDP:flavonoid glycosyltransferase YjiC (YdhE family)
MRIGIQTWGSHGDVRPFMALAEGLQAAGHTVSLVICGIDGTDYADAQSALGVRTTLLAPPITSAEEGQKIAAAVFNTPDPLRQVKTILTLAFEPVEQTMFDAAQRLAAENDLLIGHYFTHPLQTAAAQAGVPYVSVVLSHAGIPTAYDHPQSIKAFGKAGNRALWWITKLALNRILKPYPNRMRKQLGLPPIDDVLTQSWIVAPLTLLGVSPVLCQQQPDWPASVHACGFFDMPSFKPEGSVPPALADFLAAGAAPVYMTFGSWTPKDVTHQKATLELLLEAARLAGCRAIIQGPSWQECGLASSRDVLFVAAAPHQAIFPHCAAIVHHGGAGTTQAATVAGKPSVVVAHLSEQEHWGRELRRIGLAGATLHRRTLSAHTLAHEIRFVLDRPEMLVKAAAAGQAMRQENGVAQAVRLIGQTFQAGAPTRQASAFSA